MAAKYRLVSYMEPYGITGKLQVRRWWWPFWMLVSFVSDGDINRARTHAENHAKRRRFGRKITEIRVGNKFINRHAHNLTAIMFLPILFGIIIAIEFYRL